MLSLAVERTEALAILDDALAREFASHLGVSFTGTLGILLRAKTAGLLGAVKPTVDRLEELGFRLDAATRAAVLDLAGEI